MMRYVSEVAQRETLRDFRSMSLKSLRDTVAKNVTQKPVKLRKLNVRITCALPKNVFIRLNGKIAKDMVLPAKGLVPLK